MIAKGSKIFVLCLLAALGWTAVSDAAYVTVTDTTVFLSDQTDAAEDLLSYGGLYVNKLEGSFDWVGWTHHLDFLPAAGELVSAKLTVYLRDDDDGSSWGVNSWEFGFGFAEDGTWDLGSVNTKGYAYDVNVSYLLDSMFTVYVGSLLGDFFIDKSTLEVVYNPVPIPSSLLMLLSGLSGLMGLSVIRRRSKNS